MNAIHVVGLGAGDIEQLPVGIYRKLTSSKHVIYTRTHDHPVIEDLKKEGLEFYSFDSIYEQNDQFQEVYEQIASFLLEKASEQEIIYAVPGHPMLAEQTTQLLLHNSKGIAVHIEGGQSYLDALFTSLKIDPIEGFQFVDGTSFQRRDINYRHHLVFCQVYDQMIASEIKLELMEDLPEDYPVTVITAAGSTQETIKTIPLYELDRTVTLNNLTSLYVAPVPEELLHHRFETLKEVIATLRGPNGCPWDKKQTHESLRPYLIEEAYEFIQAVDQEDDDGMIEELGDVLLQVMLHSQIGQDEGYFQIEDVIRSITEKMIRRHPHVFGDETVQDADEVLGKWEDIKAEEKGEKKESSILDGISESFPALFRAIEIQKKAAKVGFDWEHAEPMWDKVEEEINEWKSSLVHESESSQELELGDILFAIVNLARYYKINPEIALQRTNHKFISRFSFMENAIKSDNKSISDLSLEELDGYWEKAKMQE
ncbi:nucleoside triphosphate pyrophosphohydrolase [Bacillaceae bacterium S4-13-58]